MLLFLTAAASAFGDDSAPTDYSADMDALQDFLDRDKSYSPEERAKAQAKLDGLRKRAADMSPAEFELAVARIAALTRNGHTMLVPAWSRRFNRISLRYHLFADGLFVIHAPEGMRELLGARVISLDGHSVDKLKRHWARYRGAPAPRRNELIGRFLESPELLHAAALAREANRVDLRLKLQDGRSVVRTLEAKIDPPADDRHAGPRLARFADENTDSVPLWLGEPDRWFRRSPLPNLKAWYVQFRINFSFGDEKIDEFLAATLADLREAKPRNLVIDLRLDDGGDLNTTREFMQILPTLVPEGGRIFALISGRTFSAGIASLGYLKQAGGDRVTIVGEPVGDHLEFWAEGRMMKLPVSGIALLPATERHNYVTGCPEPDCHASIRNHPIRVTDLDPDIAAPLTFADYRDGRDPALEAVKKALGQ